LTIFVAHSTGAAMLSHTESERCHITPIAAAFARLTARVATIEAMETKHFFVSDRR
jgi:hypothetical protein